MSNAQANAQNSSVRHPNADHNLVETLVVASPRPYPIDFVKLDGFDGLGVDLTPPTRHSLDFSTADQLDFVGDFNPVWEGPSTPVPSPSRSHVKDTLPCSSLEGGHASDGSNSTLVLRSSKVRKKRKNRKDQIIELRALVEELTQQIQNLQSSPASIDDCIRQQSTWERIATRQHKLRQKAEEDSAILLRIKTLQQREVKNFRRLFKRRIDEELMGNRQLLKRPPHVHDLVDNSRIFADLLKHSEMQYGSVDQVFQMKGMEKVPCPGQACQIPHDSTHGVIAEFLDKNLVPFSVQQSARAVWQCLGRRKIPSADHIYAEDYQQNEGTVTSYIHFLCSVGGTIAYIQEHGAARKFVEENRTVIVSQKTSEPAGKEIGSFGGLKYREEMRVVVRCGVPLASGQETAIIETHLSVFQSDEGSEAAMAFRAPGVMELAIRGWESTVSQRKQEIENLLFAELIKE